MKKERKTAVTDRVKFRHIYNVKLLYKSVFPSLHHNSNGGGWQNTPFDAKFSEKFAQ